MMKRTNLIVILLIFLSFNAIAKNVICVPEYAIEKETPIYTIISYVIEQCQKERFTVGTNIPFSIYISEKDDNRYLVWVEKSYSEILSNGEYCGYIVIDGLKFFIRGKTIDLYNECDTSLVKLRTFTNITVNNPVPDGVGPTWYFIIKDSKIYIAGFHD